MFTTARPSRDARRRSHRKGKGFTLVELLLVLVILTTLAAIVVPKFTSRSKQAKETAARTQISNFETCLDAFEVDNGYFPQGSDGLGALVEQPNDAKDWRGPYIKTIPVDPWDMPYIYEYPGKHNENSYDIMSTGPDKRPGGGDDLVNWATGS